MGYRLDSMLVRRPFPHYQDVREALQEQPCGSLGITGCEQDKLTTSKCKLNARILLANPQVPKFVCPICRL